MADTRLILHVKGTEAETTEMPREAVKTAVQEGKLTQSQLIWSAEENRSGNVEKPPQQGKYGRPSCETGFRRGFSQLTFRPEGAQYQAIRFPNPV